MMSRRRAFALGRSMVVAMSGALLAPSPARARHTHWPEWVGGYSGAVRFYRSIPLEDIFPPPKIPGVDRDDRAPFGIHFSIGSADDAATVWLRIDAGPMQTDLQGELLRFAHFTASFTPTGADVILWVFDAAGTRARTWRGFTTRRDP